jgi:hypothetical protein
MHSGSWAGIEEFASSKPLSWSNRKCFKLKFPVKARDKERVFRSRSNSTGTRNANLRAKAKSTAKASFLQLYSVELGGTWAKSSPQSGIERHGIALVRPRF